MTSRNLLNLILLVVIAGLIAIVVFEPGLAPQPSTPKLTTLKQDDITHILIQRDTDVDVELEKVNGTWQLVKPYALVAHDFRVQTILRLSEADSHSQNELSNLSKATFGLDKPKATVTFNKQHKVIFGNNEPLKQLRYVQANNTLHTIVDTFYYQVASKVSTFMDHKLLATNSKIIKLELPDQVVELQSGKWQVSPQPEDFTADSVTELLNNWRNTQAIEISKAETIKNLPTISLYLKDREEPLTFSVIKKDKEISLLRNDLGLAYRISEENYNKLIKLPDNTAIGNTE